MQYFHEKLRKSIRLLCLPIDVHRRNALWHRLNALAPAEHALNLYRDHMYIKLTLQNLKIKQFVQLQYSAFLIFSIYNIYNISMSYVHLKRLHVYVNDDIINSHANLYY